ncbi:MAG: isocitrate/isopropylmalate dehydrogenase family protein [Methanobacteriaceae archaeon]|nr:isocitrate/isopropylmalate dehydrogenase family protein [Methanobacteriaceae archaeon]
MYKITTIPGDGIGKEVLSSTKTILDTINIQFDYDDQKAGKECYKKQGTNLPLETIKSCEKTDATLFGAVTSIKEQSSAIVSLRKKLNLHMNLRPIKSPYNKDIDFIIIRENTEGLYSQLEKITDDGAIATRKITKKASENIINDAFKYAITTNRKKVTAVHKANVLKITDGLFKDIFYKESLQYPEIIANDFYVDATAMYLITQPQEFDIIVTTNLFGDILSDEAGGLIGSLGLIPSANVGYENMLFEPVHGSAPDISGKQIANPTAMILSASLMLEFLDENKEAENIKQAVYETISENKHLTPDLKGTATTNEMTNAIIKKL